MVCKKVNLGVGIVVQCVKLPPATQASHVSAVLSPDALLLIQFPTNVPGNAAEDDPNPGTLATHMAYLDGLPGSWLGPSPASTVVPFGK